MKKFLVVCLLTIVAVGFAWAAGAVEGESTQTGDRYPDIVDPFGSYDEPITVNIAKATNAGINHPEGWSYSENVWYDAIENELGIRLVNQFEALDGDDFNTRMNLAIAGNDLPDIMTLPRNSMYNRLLDADKLADMTEAYDKFAYPLFKEYYEDDGGVKKSWGMMGDQIYGFARGGLNYQSPRLVYIRKDWREELGLPRPQTMNDVLEIAEAFYQADPENRYAILINSKVLGGGFCDMTGIANSMGVYPRKWIIGDDGKITYGTIQPGMRDVIGIYRDLYERGMLYPEFAVLKGEQTAPFLVNSQIGVVMGPSWVITWPLPSLYETEGVDWEVYPILPMIDYVDEAKVQLGNVERAMYAVRRDFEYPEAFIKIMNLQIANLNDPERADITRFHSDADFSYHQYQPFYPAYAPTFLNLDTQVHVTAAIDNEFDESYLKTPHDESQYPPVAAFFTMQKAGETPPSFEWVRHRMWYGDDSVFGVLNDYRFNDRYMISPVEGIVTPEMSRLIGTLEQIEDEYVLQIITGTRPLEDFDELVERWLALGGQTIIDELNTWYEAR